MATLGVSIGAAAAGWSVLTSVLVNPLHLAGGAEWFVVSTNVPARTGPPITRYETLYSVYMRAKSANVFQDVVAIWNPPLRLPMTRNGDVRRVAVGFATFDFFDRLGIAMRLGRGFTERDDSFGAQPVAILTDAFWRREFGASDAVIGQTIQVSGRPVVIVGVAGSRFRSVDLSMPTDLYVPLHSMGSLGPAEMNVFGEAGHKSAPTAGVRVIGRLTDGERRRAAAHLFSLVNNAISARERIDVALVPLGDAAVPPSSRPGVERFLQLLMVVTLLLLSIGAVTVGLLFMVQLEARRDEFATCLALGAPVGRLVQGVSFEALILCAGGAVIAVPVSWALLELLYGFSLPGNIELEVVEVAFNPGTVIAVFAGTLLALMIVTGVVAASVRTKRLLAVSLTMRTGGRVIERGSYAVFMVAQTAITFSLLFTGGLFLKSVAASADLNPGIRTADVISGEVSVAGRGYSPATAAAFFAELRTRLAGRPAIRSISLSDEQGGMTSHGRLRVNGVLRGFPTTVWFTAVDEAYFSTVGLPITAGRSFSDEDTVGAPLAGIASESLARAIGGGTVLGAQIVMPQSSRSRPPDVVTIVGTVPDVVTDVNVLTPLVLYLPAAQRELGLHRLVTIRTDADAAVAIGALRAAIRESDPEILPGSFLTLRDRIARQMGSHDLGAAVLTTLGSIALLLAMFGTYVLGESIAAVRSREMAVRSAYGATRSNLVALMLRVALQPVVLGLMCGLVLVGAAANSIRALLFEVSPFDLSLLVGIAAMMLVVGTVVAYRPALRASRSDLARVLREQ